VQANGAQAEAVTTIMYLLFEHAALHVRGQTAKCRSLKSLLLRALFLCRR
jgi:hypothetical protein